MKSSIDLFSIFLRCQARHRSGTDPGGNREGFDSDADGVFDGVGDGRCRRNDGGLADAYAVVGPLQPVIRLATVLLRVSNDYDQSN